MKKEPYRDYATSAFVRYANLGCPTHEAYEKRVREDVYNRLAFQPPNVIAIKADAAVSIQKPIFDDIDAITKMFRMLEENRKSYISDAVRAIYLINPPKNGTFSRDEIVDRVHAYMHTAHLGERTVYRYLKHARQLFAMHRGLTIGSEDNYI